LGLVITVFSFGLIHILTTDLRNAVYTSAIFLVLGLIYRFTRNSVGPMIAWTLINGQVWYIARLLVVSR
jgi:membrane protease YdiL (CAAX protease family)